MADGQQWVGALGTVVGAVIALAATALAQIGTWRARARRAIKSDLEIVNELPVGSAERDALVASVLRRTQDLVVRANQTRGLDRFVGNAKRFLLTELALAVPAAAMAYIGLRAMRNGDAAIGDLPRAASRAETDALNRVIVHAQFVTNATYPAWVAVLTLMAVVGWCSFRFDQIENQRKASFPPELPAKPDGHGSRSETAGEQPQLTPDAGPEPALPDSAATSPGHQTEAESPPSSRRERWRSRWRRLRGG